MKIVLSGIQPTNMITIGNYLGALRNIINFQKDNKLMIFIADLHAITKDFNPKELQQNKKSIAALYMACGLNPYDNIIFYQSDVIEHSHLSYLLLCHTYMGELNRMTQFKDKSSKMAMANGTQNIPTGLFVYPTLMAADILLYDADIVPVGKDQTQHMELTRDIAIRFNKKYKEDIFKVPNIYVAEKGAKIMDLQNPEIKMSKSNENTKGTIFLLEPIDNIRKKIMSAKTDSFDNVKYDQTNQPGVSNLIIIYSCLSNKSINDIELLYKNKKYGDFKKDLADIVCNHIKELQDKYYEIIKNVDFDKQLQKNAQICQKIAAKKIDKIHKILGLKVGN